MDESPADAKARLRAERLAVRRALTADEIARARAAVAAHVLRRAEAAGWRCVAAYVPLRREPGSVELLDGLRASGVRVLVPLLLADNDLDWSPWAGPDGSAAPLGVDTVAAADALLVPALAVATDGTRLGRGGGSYDRALRRRGRGSLCAALVYDDEVLESVPAEPWDVPVSHAVSPAGWHRLAPTQLDAE